AATARRGPVRRGAGRDRTDRRLGQQARPVTARYNREVLAARGIDKAYGDRRALIDVTLEVAAGEAVLLVGRNGAGKTTLLRIATGFLDPDAGAITIDGIAMARDRARA